MTPVISLTIPPGHDNKAPKARRQPNSAYMPSPRQPAMNGNPALPQPPQPNGNQPGPSQQPATNPPQLPYNNYPVGYGPQFNNNPYAPQGLVPQAPQPWPLGPNHMYINNNQPNNSFGFQGQFQQLCTLQQAPHPTFVPVHHQATGDFQGLQHYFPTVSLLDILLRSPLIRLPARVITKLWCFTMARNISLHIKLGPKSSNRHRKQEISRNLARKMLSS